jgi:hypothetical protein
MAEMELRVEKVEMAEMAACQQIHRLLPLEETAKTTVMAIGLALSVLPV